MDPAEGMEAVMKRFKLEYLNRPNAEPLWFDTKREMDQMVELIRGCPVDDGTIRLRCTTFEAVHIELVTIPDLA
jgi:hypothetical protein